VIKPGQTVHFGDGVSGTVVAVLVRSDACVSYSVAYWCGEMRHKVWLSEHEIGNGTGIVRRRIGFLAEGDTREGSDTREIVDDR
jgi:hypothetical protein